jgi:hypothetical protein
MSTIIKMLKDKPFSDKRMMKWIKKLLSFQIDARLNSSDSFPPYLIYITPTNLCNLRYKMCGQQKVNKIY